MNRTVLVNIILAILCLASVNAQEVVTGLQSNIQVRSEYVKSDKRKAASTPDTLELPFFDDFSKITIYPDLTKWQDNFVFINNTYSNQQRTAGIATFDALDNTGRLYETASSDGFEADHLTSNPINLNYSSSENIYLSFLYEPGGLGDEPELKDSLTLEFFAPAESKWYSVWRAEGTPVHPFRAVILPVTDTRFLKKGFQFRFINYASLSTAGGDLSMSGNCDQWNLDYVLLDRNRNDADTLMRDVAFTSPVRSLLKTQESMPWQQFRKVYLSEMGPWIPISYQNNDAIVRNITRNFEITDLYKNQPVYTFSAGATNINPHARIDYKANLLYTFNSENTDSALFRIKSYIITDVYDPKQNDTILYYQKFSNYFAFDDGTSESGYGVNGLGSRNAMVAYRFKSFMPDTIRAIKICFNDSYENANLRTFDLMVWEDDNGIPGNVIYTQEEMTVTQGDGINGFYTYTLNSPKAVNGYFFVGWKQRSETFLNAGFDINTPNAGRQYYWLNGNWNQSQASGSVMIRPVVGAYLKTTSVDKTEYTRKSMRLWPNPASSILNISIGDVIQNSSPVMSIFNSNGKEIIKTSFKETLDVSGLPAGMYCIVVSVGGKQTYQGRFIKIR